MAITKVTKDLYGQIELNHVAWRRDGRIHAQSKLNATDFDGKPAENGTVLRIDPIKGELVFPKTDDVNPIYGVNYSAEEIYDERTRGLKNFKLEIGEVLPRLGLPSIGDIFTVNALAFDTDEFATEKALMAALDNIETTPLVAVQKTGAEGYFVITATTDAVANKLQCVVKEKTTMPDGQFAVKLMVVSV